MKQRKETIEINRDEGKRRERKKVVPAGLQGELETESRERNMGRKVKNGQREIKRKGRGWLKNWVLRKG